MTCECGMLGEGTTTPIGCDECGATRCPRCTLPISCDDCGAACCPNCVLAIGAQTYCRWCATMAAA